MKDRDWFDDFIDYKLNGREDHHPPAHSGGCLPVILCVLLVLWLIS